MSEPNDPDAGGRRRPPRRPERRRPLPDGWKPKDAAVVEQIKRCNLDVSKVLATYQQAMTGCELKRWRDITFLRWFDEALIMARLAHATAVPGMPVLFRRLHAQAEKHENPPPRFPRFG